MRSIKAKAKPMPSMDVLCSFFQLDAANGALIRKNGWKQHKAGQPAGARMKSGHLIVKFGETRLLVHRVIYFMANGVDPGELRVDHINGIPDDNRPENLRLATQAENGRHKVKLAVTNTSGHRNVSWCNHFKRWLVSMTVDGRRLTRKFQTKDEAVAAAQAMRAHHYGEFAGVAP